MSTSIFRFFLGFPFHYLPWLAHSVKINPAKTTLSTGTPKVRKTIKGSNAGIKRCSWGIHSTYPWICSLLIPLTSRGVPIVFPMSKYIWSNMDSLPTWEGPWCPVEPSWLAWPCGVARGMAPAPVSVHAGGCGHMAVDGCATGTSKMEMETSFPESMAFIFETLIYHDGFILTSVFFADASQLFFLKEVSVMMERPKLVPESLIWWTCSKPWPCFPQVWWSLGKCGLWQH